MRFSFQFFILLQTSALLVWSQRGRQNQNFGPSPTCSVRSGSCMTTQCVEQGPYYKAGSPIQQSGMSNFVPQVCQNSVTNDRLFMNGTVRIVSPGSPCGRPVRAMLDIWHANPDGIYSDISPSSPDFSCRTRLITSDSGFFTYSSVIPGRYGVMGGFRATHVHMKVTPLDNNNSPIGRTLTTQQYFAHDIYSGANDMCNDCHSDDPTLVVHVQHSYDVKTYDGTMDILLPAP